MSARDRFLRAAVVCIPRGQKGPSPGGPKFFTRGNIAFPSIGRSGEYCRFHNGFLWGLPCAGLKCGSSGRKQLARFWNNFHDLGLIPILFLPDSAPYPCTRKSLHSHGPQDCLSPMTPNWPLCVLGCLCRIVHK